MIGTIIGIGVSIIAVNLPFLPLAIYVLYRDKHGFDE